MGSTDLIKKDVEWRINIGKENGGYILSSACSIAPKTPPQNIELLHELVATFGKY
jgi:uroporphyrinogen-III decarboxylase